MPQTTSEILSKTTEIPLKEDQLKATLAIEASRIRHSYAEIKALQSLDLELAPSEKVALLGANGAGKSTLFKLLTGQQRLQSGELRVFGEPAGCLKSQQVIGVTPQNSGFPPQLRLKELLHWMSVHHENPLSRLELDELLCALEMKDYLNRYLSQFSGGQKRKVALILALLSRPRLILLDEPTTGLDVASRKNLLKWLKTHLIDQKVTLLFSTHHLEEVEALADRVLLIQQGRIIGDGSLEQIKAKFGGFLIRFKSGDNEKILNILSEFEKFSLIRLQEGPQWALKISEADQLVRTLIEQSVQFTHLEVIADSLEDIFLKLNQSKESL